jgi:hypothetical protein
MDQTYNNSTMGTVISPTSVRTGNLIGFGDSMCVVVEIHRTCFYVEHEKWGVLKSTTCDIKPIPLTEKLISQICFNENKVTGLYRLEASGDYHISVSLDNDMIYIGDDVEIRISETPLHRLQNIYFDLTQRELDVQH